MALLLIYVQVSWLLPSRVVLLVQSNARSDGMATLRPIGTPHLGVFGRIWVLKWQKWHMAQYCCAWRRGPWADPCKTWLLGWLCRAPELAEGGAPAWLAPATHGACVLTSKERLELAWWGRTLRRARSLH